MAFPSRPSSPLPRRLRCTPRVELLEERNLLTFYGGYLTADEIIAYEDAYAAYFPNIVQLVDYGNSYSKSVGGVTTPGGQFLAGYDLQALRITNRAIPGPKPVSIIYTGLHSREISTPEIAMRLLEYMTWYYDYDPDVHWLVDHHETWIIPLSNPDGHWYVELGTRPPFNGQPWLWRKNGRLTNPPPASSCNNWPGPGRGVDLNRNFADHWGGVGASTSPCNDTYRGPSVASEQETIATQNLVRTLIPDQRGPNDSDPAPDNTTGIFTDIHTYGGYVLWPWGHTSAPAPNSTGLGNIGRKLASYNGYTAGQSNQTLYATTGTSNGWVYTELGAPGYTIELDSGGFLAQYSTLNRLWGEVKDSLLYTAKIARAPYQLARGPDAKTVWGFIDGPWLYTYSEIDDRQNGNQSIQTAEFYVDVPPWAPGATPLPVIPYDGSFNSPYEPVLGYGPSSGISVGRHLVYARGRDSAGNWGPVSAFFLDVGTAPGGGNSGIVPTLLAGTYSETSGSRSFGEALPLAIHTNGLQGPTVEYALVADASAEQLTSPTEASSAVRAVDHAFVLEFVALEEF